MALPATKAQLLTLKICGVVIAICLVMLGIDRFFVRSGEPSEDQQLAASAAELGLRLHRSYADADGLLAITREFEGIVEPATEIGAVMTRTTDDHELIVYEHRYDARALRTSTTSHDLEVELLGILLRLPGADLPRFGVRSSGQALTEDQDAASRVLTSGAFERMLTFAGFTMAASGEHVLFLSAPPDSPLLAASQRATSAEFLPGLRNSGLKVDVQRAIDIANLLELDRPTIARVYGIDASDIKANVEIPKLDLGLDRNVEETHRKVDEIVAGFEEDTARLRAEFDAKRKASQARLRERLQQAGADSGSDDDSDPEDEAAVAADEAGERHNDG